MIPPEEKIRRLQKDLAQNPTDTNIINALAIEHLNNPSSVADEDDLKLFEKAYEIKKTIKSTHNLAWYYYMEYGATLERAIEIQDICISMKPKSFYPYFLYGCMLLENNQYRKAIESLEIAYSKKKVREIAHNLGTAYANDGNFDRAKNYLIQACNEGDIENKSKYNLAIVQIQLGEKEEALAIAEELKQIVINGVNKSDIIDAFEVAYLYYLLDDYDSAYACCKICDWNSYHVFTWAHVPYLIYKQDKAAYQKLVASKIENEQNWINENKDNDEYWEDDTEEEKQQELAELESEISRLRSLETEFAAGKPNININDGYFIEYCGCLLFGCDRHGNLKDDE